MPSATRLLQQRAALLLGVVVHAVGVGQQAEAVGDGAKVGAERVRGAAVVPAERTGADATQHDAGLPRLAHGDVDPVQPPEREQVGDRPATDPDGVAESRIASARVAVRHREELEVPDVDAPAAEGGVRAGQVAAVVAAGRHDEREPRPVLAREGQHAADGFAGGRDRVPVTGDEAPGGGHDASSGHGRAPRRLSTACAVRRPDTSAPWMDELSRWSPATKTPSPRDTGWRKSWGGVMAGSASGMRATPTVSQALVLVS